MNFDDLFSGQNDLAFIVGNGINRYRSDDRSLSWEGLLAGLWRRSSRLGASPDALWPEGISLTELYDLLDLRTGTAGKSTSDHRLQKQVAAMLSLWETKPHHGLFVEKARALNAPVLTTNFDRLLPESCGLQLRRTTMEGFTDYYPWSTYYGDGQLENPSEGFGIWYVNGMIKYPRSIRLGLCHYMGSVERARNLIHRRKRAGLYSRRSSAAWAGDRTWLDVVFKRSLCIFGLALEENKVFLRWLLIERAKYFKTFPARKKDGWYIIKKEDSKEKRFDGKKFFLEKIGFRVVEVDDYDTVYNDLWK